MSAPSNLQAEVASTILDLKNWSETIHYFGDLYGVPNLNQHAAWQLDHIIRQLEKWADDCGLVERNEVWVSYPDHTDVYQRNS